MSQTIDVPALEAALPLLNQGKGCGRLVKERRQLLSFCLERKKKKVKTCLNILFAVIFKGYKTKRHHVPANQRP